MVKNIVLHFKVSLVELIAGPSLIESSNLPIIVTAKSHGKANTMTASWGGFGTKE